MGLIYAAFSFLSIFCLLQKKAPLKEVLLVSEKQSL